MAFMHCVYNRVNTVFFITKNRLFPSGNKRFCNGINTIYNIENVLFPNLLQKLLQKMFRFLPLEKWATSNT